MLSLESRHVALAIAVASSLAVAAGSAMAQAQQAPPRLPGAATAPAEIPAEKAPTMGMLEGAVTKVDPAAGTVQVASGPFGIVGRTLEVTSDTQIQVEGRQGSLADVREGAKVKASYESRGGKNLATQIEVMPAQGSQKGGTGQMPGKTQ